LGKASNFSDCESAKLNYSDQLQLLAWDVLLNFLVHLWWPYAVTGTRFEIYFSCCLYCRL